MERDVAETLPAVQRHKANLDQLISTLKAQFEAKKKELGEFQTKYKIRVQGQDDDDDEGDRKAGPSSNSSGAGVLVANK